ncbi:hypothetical protein [Segatella sp.]|uniref:hypothetical protein n=1 Tax=Segatella sp. TaxID=2974253 RepID=UPI003AADA2DB
MSDAIVRLLLNTQGFDDNLKKSKNEISRFSDFMAGAGETVAKFAGGLGAAMTVGEAFNKTLQSSQVLGDMTASTMQAAKESVDQFFYSIGNGEFSSFLSGLDEIIQKAKEAYAAMDQLGNTKISYGYFSSKNEAQIQEAQYVAKNKFAPLEKRVKAFGNWRKALEQQKQINETLRNDLVSAITKSVESEIGTGKIKVGFEDVEMALKIDVTDPAKRGELKERYSNSYNAYQARKEYLTKARKGASDEARIEGIDKELAELDNIYKEAIIVNAMLNKYKDEELSNIAAMASEYQKISSALNSMSREYNEDANEFNNANKAIKGFVAVASLEGYKVYTGETGDKKPIRGKSESTDFRMASFNAENWANEEAKGLHNALRKKIESGEKIKIVPIEVDLDKIDIAVDKDKLPDFSSQIDKNKQYAESLGYIGDAFSSIGSIVDDSNAAVIQYFANLINSMASAIPMIASMVTAKKAEANANAEAAATGAASSVSSIPFVGPAMAVAAVASILAAFASIPKFADGGIIGGSSFFGDKMIARVNSGEMILNQSQQGRLFQMINSGNLGGNVKVDGEIKVRGKAMYIAIRNYMKSENIKW